MHMQISPSRTPDPHTGFDRIAFIGGGQMAGAMISGLLKAGHAPDTLLVVEPAGRQRHHLESTLGVRAHADAGPWLAGASIVLWAVKPQMMRQVIATTLPFLGDALHLSIAAGLSLETLSGWLQTGRVVRAMPNTSALIGAGVTGLFAGPGVSADERTSVQGIVATMGRHFWVGSDLELDAVTAVSGSGPAYLFHFLESFQAAAEAIGFDASTARELVLDTAIGAIEQARRGDDFGDLRVRVTSKGGTTEAALKVFDAAGSAAVVSAAVRAALMRAGSLSNELSA